MAKQVTAIIVGAGHRGLCYAEYALKHPDEFRIVGVADPNEFRRKQAAEIHGIPPEMCFETAEELAARPKFADAVINGTMDRYHIPTSLPLLEAGYDLLLEKPIAPTADEVVQLKDVARRNDRKVMICHVLRYAPFYTAIRRKVLDGEIGELQSVQTQENVSYHHMAVGFVRGKWRREADSTPMLMAKCCHDLDLVTWMKSGVTPKSVASFGSLTYFKPENAPEGSGTRCLADCKIEGTCPYSAQKHYIEQGLWGFYAWEGIETSDMSVETKLKSLQEDNPYGRCVWHCDNDVVDHQAVIVEFADGSTATHDMVGGVSRPCRTMHLIGTNGEIEGVTEQGSFVVRHHDARAEHEYSEERIEVNVKGDGHGGGDLRLAEDFVRVLQGDPPSISSTSLDDSVYGHLIGFAAEESRHDHRVVQIAE
jgi:predicted dehydrogenase